MDIILCGYSWTGCEALRLLNQAGHNCFVYTHDSPYHIPSLVEYCRQIGVPFSTQDVSKSKLPFEPDCVASIYYRHIIKPHVIEACQGKIFNLHPSLLPAYRGCSSLTWAMIEGETCAGYTYHYIDRHCDTGDIIRQQEIPILPFDNQGTLYQRVGFEAMKDFPSVLKSVAEGQPGTPQVGEASYYRRGCPFDGQISEDWQDEKVERFIRAMIHPPYPLATFEAQEIRSMNDFYRLKSQLKKSA